MNLDQIEFEEDDLLDFEKDADTFIDNDLLEEILLLTSLFENIQPLTLETIQQFLLYKKLSYRMPKIRAELKKVSKYYNDLRFNRIKLNNNSFAYYVLKKYFSSQDIEDFIFSVFEWMSISPYLLEDFIGSFILFIKHNNLLSETKFNESITLFIETLKDDSIRISEIGMFLINNSEYWELSFKFINRAVDLENSEAISFLGYSYLTGNKISKDIVKAERLLTRASELGSIKSKLILASVLFNGEGLEKNVERGYSILKQAVELGSKKAKYNLALRYSFGIDIPVDLDKSNQYLWELIDVDYVDAMRLMGCKLVSGDGVVRDVYQGLELLKKSTNKGSKSAKFELARYLTTVFETEIEFEEGLQYLEELVQENHVDSKRHLSELIISGQCVKKDIDIGIKLLMELVNDGDEESIVEYARLHFEGGSVFDRDINKGQEVLENFINNSQEANIASSYLGELLVYGQYVERNPEKGISLLEKSSDSGHLLSIRRLASKYLYGIGVPVDFHKGENILLKAISRGDVSAKYQYSKALLNKKGRTEQEKTSALELLNNAAVLGSLGAKTYLATLLIDGEIIPSNVDKGLEHLNESIALAYPPAMRELGYRQVTGIGIPRSTQNGEKLLKRAILLGDILAKTILGKAIIFGDVENANVSEGFLLLEEASMAEEPNSMRILGTMLLKGVHGHRDKKRGEELLRLASKKKDSLASLQLANMLLDGVLINSNIDEGKQLLIALFEEGDADGTIELANRLISGKAFDKDVTKGLQLLEQASQNNIVNAKFEYAYKIITGENGIAKNLKKGEQLLREALLNSHIDSSRFLAQLLIDGTLQELEPNEGIKLLEKLEKDNDALAMEQLGEYYLEGIYVERNIEKGLQLFEKIKTTKNQECKVNYAVRLITGDIIPKDETKGMKLLAETALSGSQMAKYRLAEVYIFDRLATNKIEEGLGILSELVQDGDDNAKETWALLLIHGHGLKRDAQKGIEMLEHLVKKDNLSSMLTYSKLLLEGRYIPKDTIKGEKLLKHLCHKGVAKADYMLANRYLLGEGLKKHVANGIEKLRKAANLSVRPAMLEYGMRLKKGNKVQKNETKGNEFIDKALKNAKADELHELGVVAYQNKDNELATKLLFEAYNKGTDDSGSSLVYMYRRNELRCDMSKINGFSLLQKGLLNNSTTAVLNLVLMLVRDEKSEEVWRMADEIIRKSSECSLSMDWWYDISEHDDDEGHLIIGWLAKHEKICDISNIRYQERFKKLLTRGWYIPDWMLEENSVQENKGILVN
ncbi:hypothetical protein B2K_34355 [Paenibacillus mucilaginosus K02]|uniref:Uncharacterized protein n=1 Tax=Paenibacillus mucilaginosus K02 TaxID=997761 RepID=I0BTM9_9BACL|nr:hypothetical protein B2K_34355 [Paenibacillus mucilaginosus K02]